MAWSKEKPLAPTGDIRKNSKLVYREIPDCKGAFEMSEQLKVHTSYLVMVRYLFIGNSNPLPVSKDKESAIES
ncbi:hypothetical protein U0X36_05530 [Bacillus thuringiensis]|uniref:hypothetical protein n=1 Tax=Bacillus thuringiensis TaxID=1428 RepID=UPI000E48C0E2|nr:hypothetical protein [Bacillus thuringiensis]MDZ3952404.1 hypothetical protein [Bacillus thuringiensis]RGP45226.1 hypothetical protein BTW32_26040 [Bacillus thuringiensis]